MQLSFLIVTLSTSLDPGRQHVPVLPGTDATQALPALVSY